MAQATQITMTGRETGNLNYCTLCGGSLELVDGTDPEKTEAYGGFEEQYECQNCDATGTYKYRTRDAMERFMGACAGEVPL